MAASGTRSRTFWVHKTGNTLNSHKDFIDRLKKQIPLQEVDTQDACDFILVFCPIVSQAGTDIEAALKKIQNISDIIPAVLVALHHTFDPDCVVPDSRRIINRKNMIAVDCFFHEDQGLLQCSKNNESLSTTSKYIKSQVEVLHKNVRKQGEGVKSDLELSNRAKSNEEKDALLEDRNSELVKMTNEAQESKNIQHERDQQLNPKYTHIQKGQELVELMEKRLVEWQKEMAVQLKDLKNCLEVNVKALSEKDAELVKTNENFKNATEQIKEKNKTLEEKDTQLKELKSELKEKDTQLKEVKGELEEKDTQLIEVKSELKEKDTQLKELKSELEEKDTQLKEVKSELEVKDTQLKELKSELEEEYTQLIEVKSELEEKDTQLKELKSELEEKDTQLKELKSELEEKDTQLKEVKGELEKASTNLKENERHLKQKERQLENVGKELETSKNKLAEKESLPTERETQLMERDKQLREKDRLLAAQTLQMKDETLKQNATQFKQEKEPEEEGTNTGIGELPGPKCHLVLESKSQMKEKESELEKEVNMPSQEQEQEGKEQEQPGDNLARGTDN